MTRGEHIRAAREARGLFLRDLEELSGVPYQTISRIENDHAVPRLDTVELLADALGMSIDDLIGRTAPDQEEGLRAVLSYKLNVILGELHELAEQIEPKGGHDNEA